jgi:hypothetical protein
MYCYKQAGSPPYYLYSVGYHESNGKWISESVHLTREEAINRMIYLNRSANENLSVKLTREEIMILQTALLFQQAELKKLHERALEIGTNFQQITFLLQNAEKLKTLSQKLNDNIL